MGVRTSTPQVHVWFQPLSARAQSAPRNTRSTAWQAQRGCDHHPLAREDLAFALSVVLLGLLVMVTRISQATAGGMWVSCVSTPRPTAQASRRLASKHLCGRTIFRHHPWCKLSPSILVLAAVSVLAPVQNGLAETASADGAISTQRRRSAHRDDLRHFHPATHRTTMTHPNQPCGAAPGASRPVRSNQIE